MLRFELDQGIIFLKQVICLRLNGYDLILM